MIASTASPTRPAGGLPWPFARWFLPFGLLFVAWLWWDVALRQATAMLAAQPHRPAIGVAGPAAFMTALRFVLLAAEAAVYVLWWRTRGARLPFVRFYVMLVALSAFDLFAMSLGRAALRTPALAPWFAPLTGIAILDPHTLPLGAGLRAGFGSLGLLTLGRIACTAWAQAMALGRGMREPLLVTGGLWLATRLILWWSLDIFRGMSPLP